MSTGVRLVAPPSVFASFASISESLHAAARCCTLLHAELEADGSSGCVDGFPAVSVFVNILLLFIT